MSIIVLSDAVASQIAAGEVVERASSVVKELLENALDAGATRVSIRVNEAGKRLIEVADNGRGIQAQDLSLAVTRHATSKLVSAEDLFHIRTLGFRGEALASIGSVSHMTITSCAEGQSEGRKILVDGGALQQEKTCAAPLGTIITVTDLFFNTPARLKFLKSDQTEKQQIETLVSRYAVAYASLSIQLEMDGKVILRTSGSGDRREVLANLYGYDFSKGFLEVLFEDQGVKINGYISPISVTRSNRREITFFVNGRWIQDAALSAALMKAYQTYLMVGRYPITFLCVDLAPEEVDVNVHPAKAEVRFKQPDLLFTSIQRAVKRALMAYSPIPQLAPTQWQPASRQVDTAWINAQLNLEENRVPQTTFETSNTVTESTGHVEEISSGGNPHIPLLRLVGQIGATYLVAEGPDGLYLIDQHAAHERILFEKMTGKPGKIHSQTLLQPEVVQFAPQTTRVVSESLDILNTYGFCVEEFGLNTFRVTAIPSIFTGGDAASALRCITEDFEEDETPLKGLLVERLIARICKRMAIKGGQHLSHAEQVALLDDLEGCVAPRTCPHGRPTMIHLSVDLLERQFGRRGARNF